MTHPKCRSYSKGSNRSHPDGVTSADFRQALDLEDAAYGVNQINARKRRMDAAERQIQREDYARRKITLSPTLDAWLRKELPE